MKDLVLIAIFSFLSIFNGLLAQDSRIEEKEIQQIYQELTNAVGDFSHKLPKVIIRPQKKYGASYRKSENIIFIDQAAIDICASLGENAQSAIAFLLGHELTHYYQKHDWQEVGFTTGFIVSEATFQAQLHHEKEADMYSAFISHLAGYNSVNILPQLLEKIYDVYELKDKTATKYPPLSERKTLANNICKTVQGLIDIYQTANYLYALGKFEEAMVSYEYVLKYVKYKELYNNIGLCALYATIPNIKRDFPFVYPLLLDTNIPLRAPSGFTKEELIQKAIQNFIIATNYDNSYFPSYLHLICAYDLNGQYQEAIPLLNSIRRLATTSKTQQQLLLIEGILAFRNNHEALAKNYLLKVNNDAPDLKIIANQNLSILKGEKIPKTNTPHLPIVEDKIEVINLLFFENTDKAIRYNLRDTPFNKKTIAIQSLQQSKIYIFNTNEQVTKIQVTRSSAITSKQGIGIGASLDILEKKYPTLEQRLIPHLNGFYLVIPTKGLLFNLNQVREIIEWGVFVD